MKTKLISAAAIVSLAGFLEAVGQTSLAPTPSTQSSPIPVGAVTGPESVPPITKPRRAPVGPKTAPPAGEMGIGSATDFSWSVNTPAYGVGTYTPAPASRNVEKGASVLLFKSNDPTFVDQMEEDLNIMSVVLERNFRRGMGDESPTYHMGIPMLLSSGSKSVHALYVEGFGAMLSFKVNFPLVAPSIEQPPIEPVSDGSEWDAARAELYGHSDPNYPVERSNSPAVEYNDDQVQLLKKTLLDSVKNGAHIRGLKPDEFVSITVFGAESLPAIHRTVTDHKLVDNGIAPARALAESRATLMTIRVKKSDVDARMKESLTAEDFEKRAELNAYFGSVRATRTATRGAYSGTTGLAPVTPGYSQKPQGRPKQAF